MRTTKRKTIQPKDKHPTGIIGATKLTDAVAISLTTPDYLIVEHIVKSVNTLSTIDAFKILIIVANRLNNNRDTLLKTTQLFGLGDVEELIKLSKDFLDRQYYLYKEAGMLLNNAPTEMEDLTGKVKFMNYQELVFLNTFTAQLIEDNPNIETLQPDKNVKSFGSHAYESVVRYAKRILKIE